MTGLIVIVNGASSAGKSTLVAAAQPLLPRPFLAYGLDLLLFGPALARTPDGRPRDWSAVRPRLLDGHRHSVRAFADAGVDVISDIVLESQADADAWDRLLVGYRVIWVGLHASLQQLRAREQIRGDRTSGEAERDHAVVHTFHTYDVELDSSDGVQSCARRLAAAVVSTERDGTISAGI